MKFSVIIPLYNKAPYIRKALESVLAQTYTDFELIVVDDGSTDESASIAETMLRKNKGYRLEVKGKENEVIDYSLEIKGEENSGAEINAYNLSPINYKLNAYNLSPINYKLIRQANAGVAAARNNGVAQANGDYLAFLDADDWWEPIYLKRMAQLIADYPDAGLYACNYVYYKPGKTHVALNIPTGYINYPKAYYESGAMPVWTGATMIPRAVFDEMGGFPEGIKLGEDFLLWAKIALQYKVAFLNEALAWYNNDVPVNLRATRNLHHPNNHMLFRMELAFDDEEIVNQQHKQLISNNFRGNQLPAATKETKIQTTEDWKRLIDKLRVGGLLDYWLSKEYHDLAARELAKVDWNKQPVSVKRMYKTPIWMLKAKRQVMKWGSVAKQCVIRLKVRG